MQGQSIKYFFQNVFLDIMFFFLGIALTVGSIRQPEFGESYKSPGIFPVIVGIILLLVSSIRLISAIINSRNTKEKANSNKDSEVHNRKTNLVVPMIVILVYISLLGSVNFYVLTFLFINSLMYILGARKIFRLLLVSTITTVAIWLIFVQMFSIFLP